MVLVSEPGLWQRQAQLVSQVPLGRQVLPELRERRRLAWEDWKYQRVEKACRESCWFLIEPNRRVWISLRLEPRSDPPSVSVSHFPAAASRGI